MTFASSGGNVTFAGKIKVLSARANAKQVAIKHKNLCIFLGCTENRVSTEPNNQNSAHKSKMSTVHSFSSKAIPIGVYSESIHRANLNYHIIQGLLWKSLLIDLIFIGLLVSEIATNINFSRFLTFMCFCISWQHYEIDNRLVRAIEETEGKKDRFHLDRLVLPAIITVFLFLTVIIQVKNELSL